MSVLELEADDPLEVGGGVLARVIYVDSLECMAGRAVEEELPSLGGFAAAA
jgi:hypothetical protein